MEPQASETETKEQLIERLLEKAELDVKCSGGHCGAMPSEPFPGVED